MGTYSPNSRTHRILERLSQGGAGLAEIGLSVGLPSRKGRRDQMWHLMGTLLRDQLIGGTRQRYYITAEGGYALDAMDAGNEVCIAGPSVRRFA